MNTIDKRRIMLFVLFAYAIAWLAGLVIYLTGGLAHSPMLLPGVPLALVLMAVPYMWAPALANVLTRLVTHEGWHDLWLRPNFRRGWRDWLLAWVLPALLTLAGAALFFLLFPRYFDPNLTLYRTQLAASQAYRSVDPWLMLAIQALQAVLLAPMLNAPATFGEEFGWRAYLLPHLLPLGWRKACLWIGLIWGVWHWPVIFMGYEYGFSYPGYPMVGPLLFILVTFGLGTLLGWLTLRSGSLWPGVIGHGAVNGIAGIAALATRGAPNPLLGPLPVGIIGFLGFAACALLMFFSNPIRSAALPAEASQPAASASQPGG